MANATVRTQISRSGFVTQDEAELIERFTPYTKRMIRGQNFYGTSGTNHEGPHAYLALRPPEQATPAHFHHDNQFQLFFGGKDTTFQRHLAGPLLFHYVDADTMYGPFAAGEDPYSILVLRNGSNHFTGYMPENKDDMSHDGPKRHYEFDLGPWLEELIPDEGESIVEPVFQPHGDHLAAYKVTIPSGAVFQAPSPAGSNGQFQVGVKGEVECDGRNLAKLAVSWTDPTDNPPLLSACAGGAKVVVMQLGHPSP